jgi:hypothetical protein
VGADRAADPRRDDTPSAADAADLGDARARSEVDAAERPRDADALGADADDRAADVDAGEHDDGAAAALTALLRHGNPPVAIRGCGSASPVGLASGTVTVSHYAGAGEPARTFIATIPAPTTATGRTP